MKIDLIRLTDDGQVPNHPRYPLIHYREAVAVDADMPSPEEMIARFESNDWGGAWVDGIYPFHHYHARSHEVLANLGAPVEVQFGGAEGPVITFAAGDVVAIPAGGGHCRLSDASGLVVVGAYPQGQEAWDLKRADNPADYARAHDEIASVARPAQDPLSGHDGPLLEYWLD